LESCNDLNKHAINDINYDIFYILCKEMIPV